MKKKHPKDGKHGKNGYIGGNPRYGKSRGNFKGERAKDKGRTRSVVV